MAGQQRERALLDGGGPVRRGGDKKDGRGACEGQRQPDGPRSARSACFRTGANGRFRAGACPHSRHAATSTAAGAALVGSG